jgi:hypothetical protein
MVECWEYSFATLLNSHDVRFCSVDGQLSGDTAFLIPIPRDDVSPGLPGGLAVLN